MRSLPGYRMLEQIHESMHSIALRAQRIDDDLPVIVKMLKEEYPPLREVARYRREFELSSQLAKCTGLVRILELRESDRSPALVVEDYGAESLKKILREQRFSIEQVLEIGIQITSALAELHAAGVIHKDLNPGNILLNLKTFEVKLADLGFATVLSKETPGFQNPEVLEGTLAYISPEQTGRVGLSVDFRTDLYSFGATLYELLTGCPPFGTQDPQALVHYHIVKDPTPPDVLRSEIPALLSRIVLKLMAKTPEERYQSATGLKADLEACLVKLHASGQIDDFELATRDFCPKLLISERFYGREQERKALVHAFEQACQGRSSMLLVSGYSGIGKTSLIRQLFPKLTERRGFYISGKFDQLQRNRPYKAFLDALLQLVQYLLGENEQRLRIWRERMLVALGQNAGVMVEMLPDLALLIGPQPAPAPLDPKKSQNRFNLLFQRFLGALGAKDTPLVLFLDDLQWADAASLQLLQLTMSSGAEQYLLVLGAYRDNEVPPGHPLRVVLEHIQTRRPVQELHLCALQAEHVNSWLADTLRCSEKKSEPLAHLLHAKTGGNPFFFREYLQALVTDGLLNADPHRGGWHWDLSSVEAQRVTDNVADLVIRRIKTYSSEARRILTLASCLGNLIDLETLSIICEVHQSQAIRMLEEAISDGLLVPVCQNHESLKYLESTRLMPARVEYKFAHDRIQQAFRSLIAEEERQQTYWKIGQLLLQGTPEGQREHRLFDIVNQLNQGVTLLSSDAERYNLAALNLEAGQKALQSAAFEQAYAYCKTGLSLLSQESWSARYDLTLGLYNEAAQTAWLSAHAEEMWPLTDEVLEQAHNPQDRGKAHNLRIAAHIAQNNPRKAILEALGYLRALGISLPASPGFLRTSGSLLHIKMSLNRRTLERLVDLPLMDDSHQATILKVMTSVASALYQCNPNLLVLMQEQRLRVILRYGHSAWSSSTLSAISIMLAGVLGDLKTAYEIGKIGMVLIEKHQIWSMKCRTNLMYCSFAAHCKEPVRETLPSLLSGYQIGLENGDPEWAAFSLHMFCQHGYLSGQELGSLDSELRSHSDAMRRLEQKKLLTYNQVFHQAVLNLRHPNEHPCMLSGESLGNEQETILELERLEDGSCLAGVFFLKLHLGCIFGNWELACESAKRFRTRIHTVRGTYMSIRFYLYESLALMRGLQAVRGLDRWRALYRVHLDLEILRKRAAHAPENHNHAVCLVEAEQYKVTGHREKALECYSRAIELARNNLFPNDEALATELLATFHFENKELVQGVKVMRDARYKYLKWGAASKIKQLERSYPDLGSRST